MTLRRKNKKNKNQADRGYQYTIIGVLISFFVNPLLGLIIWLYGANLIRTAPPIWIKGKTTWIKGRTRWLKSNSCRVKSKSAGKNKGRKKNKIGAEGGRRTRDL